MVKRLKTSKKMTIGIKCQCKDRAVARPGSLLRRVQCRKCGKIFRTNQKSDICFDCERQSR